MNHQSQNQTSCRSSARTSQEQGRDNIAKVKTYLMQLQDSKIPREDIVKPIFPCKIRRPLYTIPGMFDFEPEDEV